MIFAIIPSIAVIPVIVLSLDKRSFPKGGFPGSYLRKTGICRIVS